MVRDDDRRRCDDYAKDEVAAFGQVSTTVNVLEATVVAPFAFIGGAVLAVGGGGVLWAVPFGMIGKARDDARSNRSLHEQAVNVCLELTRSLRPEYPDLADSLDKLAARYAALGARFHELAQGDVALAKGYRYDASRGLDPGFARRVTALEARSVARLKTAKQLYRRVLAIREKALGPDHLDVADTLEHYAALLRKMNRDADADALDARAQAIRTTHEPPQEPEAPSLSPTPQS
jgi:hypothetical protein